MKVETAYYVVSSILKDETLDLNGKTFLIVDSLKNGVDEIDEPQDEESFKEFDPSCFDKPLK